MAGMRLRKILKFFAGGLCETMSAFGLIMSAYHPASDLPGGAFVRLLLTQSGHSTDAASEEISSLAPRS